MFCFIINKTRDSMKNIVLFILQFTFIQGIRSPQISFIILSQENQYNSGIAEDLKFSICEQATILGERCPPTFLSHIDLPHVGDWTIIPILSKIYELAKNSSWLIILEERSIVRLKKLNDVLRKYDHTKEIWIGHALKDSNPTIIHHFHDVDFNYPHMGAGIVITIPLLHRLSERISKARKVADFSIDRSFEYALFIWNEANKTSLIHDDTFCTEEKKNCAIFAKKFEKCEKSISVGSLYFLVKTCSKFHSDRVPVVLRTWGRYAKNLKFISDEEDASIPTISVGIPNTENGHCGKTIAMMKYLNEKIMNDNSIKWVVIADDDTILGVHRMTELLSCYNPDDDVAMGERYGYSVYNSLGFNYITGGGGMVFSKMVLKKLADTCICPSISAPDDMILGHCLADLGVTVTHSYLFHQARPMDYSRRFLESDRHISFHKHWMLDPIEVYEKWFAQEDSKLDSYQRIKSEL